MRRKPPAEVVVGPHVYTVRFDRDAMSAVEGNGATLADESVFMLTDLLSLSQEQETVLHEVLHGLWKLTGLSAWMDDSAADGPGENVINRLAPALLDLLQRNPALLRYLA